MRRLVFATLMLLALAGTAWGRDPEEKRPPLPSPPDARQDPLVPTAAAPPGERQILLGDRAPDFELDGSSAAPVRLADLKGSWAVLAFDEVRSKLGRLRMVDDSVRAQGARLYGVCPDGAGALKTFAGREGVAFPLLSDPGRELSRRFGMYDETNVTIQSGIVLVDPQGVIRAVYQGPALHPDDVLRLVEHTIWGT